MGRPEELLQKIEETIERGETPSAKGLANVSGLPEEDVHRLLTILERRGEVETFPGKAGFRKVSKLR